MKTNVYIDGFNFYYNAVKNTPYKWLNFNEMCVRLLPQHTINKIMYFTARVKARPSDPDQPTRQQTYLRALQTLSNVEIVLGHFLSSEIMMPLANPVPNASPCVRVIKTEEKGSDVNIATYLLRDGFLGEYEAAVLITNDSDLVEPIKVIRKDLGIDVGVLIPPTTHPSVDLRRHASFNKPIRKAVLAASQFSNTLIDSNGIFHKPNSW